MIPEPRAELVRVERAPLPFRQNVLADEWKRVFSRVADLAANVGYLEARLCELLRPDETAARLVAVSPEVSASAPFTQRLAALSDLLEEQVCKVESMQRRLDI